MDLFCELADRCKAAGLILELGVASKRKEDGARLDPPVWWLSVEHPTVTEPIVRGARGQVEQVIPPLARDVSIAVNLAGW